MRRVVREMIAYLKKFAEQFYCVAIVETSCLKTDFIEIVI